VYNRNRPLQSYETRHKHKYINRNVRKLTTGTGSKIEIDDKEEAE
jgi:hypothetical protein